MADRYLRDSQIIATGWIPADETWTYSSADSPIFVATVSGDQTSKYWAGQRVKLTQTTDKYFIIHAVSYSAPNTLITLYGGTDYTLTSATITSAYYSTNKSPLGFPMNPSKWTISASGGAAYKDNPVSGTFYGTTGDPWTSGSNITTICQIGIWNIKFKTQIAGDKTSATVDGTCALYDGATIIYNYQAGYSVFNTMLETGIILSVPAKKTHYIIMKTDISGVSRITLYNYSVNYICAYL